MSLNMQTKLNLAILLMAAALCMACVGYAAPMGTAFTYQGRLADANSPAEGLYDFEFAVFNALDGGTQQGSTLSENGKDVIDGYFTVTLDFGAGVFTGDARWLQIAVRGAGTENFTTLSPRTELTPTPYAFYAQTAGGDGDWRISGNNMYAIPSGTVSVSGTVVLSRSHDAAGPGLKVKRSLAPPLGGSTWMNIDSTSIDTYYPTIPTSGTTLKLNSKSSGAVLLAAGGGNVGIGTTYSGAKLGVNGQIKITGGSPGADKVLTSDATGLATWQTPVGGSASVPIGTVIDWWRPNDTFAVPDGYQMCDGNVVNDAQSPFNGQRLPDLRYKFVMGAGTLNNIGVVGGSTTHTHSISGSTDGRFVTMGWSNLNAVGSLAFGPTWEFAEKAHRHATNLHSHGRGTLANSAVLHLPPSVQLLKIMRIR